MVKVIKKPRFSLWRYEQIYECEFPRHCSNPLALAARYFKDRGVRDVISEPQGIQFSRGSNWASFFRFSELRQKQRVNIRLDGGRRSLICQYRVFSPYPDLHIPPWRLQKEIQLLDLWIQQHVDLGHAAPAAKAEGNERIPRPGRRR